MAAGNEGYDIDLCYYFPGSCTEPNVFVVASSDCNNQLSSFTNIGMVNVDLATPGEDIQSLIGDFTIDGTSFAAPFVTAGAAAVALNQVNTDEFDYECVFEAIRSTVTDKDWADYCSTGGVYNLSSALHYECTFFTTPPNNSTLLGNPNNNMSFTFFSNSETLSLSVESSEEQRGLVQVYNLSGKRIMETDLSFYKGANHFEVEGFGNVPSGIYLVSTIIGGEVNTMKCLKQ